MRRFEEPADGCLIPTILGGGFAVFCAVLAIALTEAHPIAGMRLIAPVYALGTYWGITMCNRRTLVVDASGVRVSYGPYPTLAGQFIPRTQIAFCLAADTIRDHDEGTKPNGTFFAIGIETRDGRRLHLYSRDADEKIALAAADEISQILGTQTRLVPAGDYSTTSRREFVFWGVMAVAAFVIGIAWELR